MDPALIKSHIIDSFERAKKQESKLSSSNDILRMEGLSSVRGRHLFNNLLSLPIEINYLEIGASRGSTLASALFGNEFNSVYSIDFSYNEPDFTKNTRMFDFEKFEEDCFEIDLKKIKHPINVYFFDGGHTYEDHYKALEYYYPILTDDFMLIVDDWDPVPGWEQVQQGTRDAIKDLKLEILFEKNVPSQGRNHASSWWNGYFVAHLKKA